MYRNFLIQTLYLTLSLIYVIQYKTSTTTTDAREAEKEETEPNAFVLKFQNKALLCELFKMKYGNAKASPDTKRLVTKLAKYESSILKPSEESDESTSNTTTAAKNSTSETSQSKPDQSNNDLQLRLDARLAEIESLRSTISSLRVPPAPAVASQSQQSTSNNNNEVLMALSKDISTLQASFNTSLSSLKSSHQDSMEQQRKRYQVSEKQCRDAVSTLVSSLAKDDVRKRHLDRAVVDVKRARRQVESLTLRNEELKKLLDTTQSLTDRLIKIDEKSMEEEDLYNEINSIAEAYVVFVSVCS